MKIRLTIPGLILLVLISCSDEIDLRQIKIEQSSAVIQAAIDDPFLYIAAPIPYERESLTLKNIPRPGKTSLSINGQAIKSKSYNLNQLKLGPNILNLEYKWQNGKTQNFTLNCYRSLPIFRSTPESFGLTVGEPRFVSHDPGTLTDLQTGLTWVDDGMISGLISGNDMNQWIEEYNRGELGDNRGFTDWRIPNRKELRSLHNYYTAMGSLWLNEGGFHNIQGSYWSYNRSDRTGDFNETWTVLMNNVHSPQLVLSRNGCYLLPVRGESNLPKTGEKPGQDNSAGIHGIPWPEIRFFDKGDGTMIDNMTGLVWMKDTAVSGLLDYPDALKFLENMNRKGNSDNQGYTDWRMPSVDELESLTHLGVQDGEVWLEEQGFENVRSQYKSETPSDETEDFHMTLLPMNGLIVHNFDDLKHLVWLVRGPEAPY